MCQSTQLPTEPARCGLDLPRSNVGGSSSCNPWTSLCCSRGRKALHFISGIKATGSQSANQSVSQSPWGAAGLPASWQGDFCSSVGTLVSEGHSGPLLLLACSAALQVQGAMCACRDAPDVITLLLTPTGASLHMSGCRGRGQVQLAAAPAVRAK